MARQKKESVSLHMKVDAELMQRFNAYCDEVGQTKTMAFERIVASFLDKKEKNVRKNEVKENE
ncbi:hypothetical protein [Pyramidobacter piscolens]|uniref:hypothetical protein n=1 Tax=Pyramidobacter piscolens TaxID=638849 RepID=UPI00266DA350|nr:hypothetical protein [Pyramidobacter piscolens]